MNRYSHAVSYRQALLRQHRGGQPVQYYQRQDTLDHQPANELQKARQWDVGIGIGHRSSRDYRNGSFSLNGSGAGQNYNEVVRARRNYGADSTVAVTKIEHRFEFLN